MIELVPVDTVLSADGDELDDEERERLHESLREGIRQMHGGDGSTITCSRGATW